MKSIKGINWVVALTLTAAFWLAFDSLAIGLGLGIAMGVALASHGTKH